jgi:hypothetical protein
VSVTKKQIQNTPSSSLISSHGVIYHIVWGGLRSHADDDIVSLPWDETLTNYLMYGIPMKDVDFEHWSESGVLDGQPLVILS